MARQLLQLLRRDRRPHHSHRLLDPRLVGGEHVHVPLDDHCPTRLGDGRARAIDPIQGAALPVELALRRVQVLRFRVGPQRPRPEPLDSPPTVAHREHDPRPEAVVVTTLPSLLHQSGRRQLGNAESGPLSAGEHLIPGARRVPHAERPQDLVAETARRQVLARLAGLLRFPEVIRIELRRPTQRLPQPRAPLPRLLGPGILALSLKLDAITVRQRLHRLAEAQTLLLLHEPEHVAACLAAEAVVELLPCVHRERRCALLVERAQARIALAASPQIRVRGDDLDDVGGVLHTLDRLRREPAAA